MSRFLSSIRNHVRAFGVMFGFRLFVGFAPALVAATWVSSVTARYPRGDAALWSDGRYELLDLFYKARAIMPELGSTLLWWALFSILGSELVTASALYLLRPDGRDKGAISWALSRFWHWLVLRILRSIAFGLIAALAYGAIHAVGKIDVTSAPVKFVFQSSVALPFIAIAVATHVTFDVAKAAYVRTLSWADALRITPRSLRGRLWRTSAFWVALFILGIGVTLTAAYIVEALLWVGMRANAVLAVALSLRSIIDVAWLAQTMATTLRSADTPARTDAPSVPSLDPVA